MDRQELTEIPQKSIEKSRQHLYQRPYIFPILGLIIGFGIVAGVVLSRHGQTLKVSENHVVFLFDKGQRKTLDSKAKTVGELLKESSVKLNTNDVVEPGLQTKIYEDNYRVNIYRARPVTVIDGKNKTVTLTAQRSARVVAEKAGLKVFSEDNVVFGQGNLKSNTIGEEVVIQRAIPIYLDLYGKPVKTRTYAKTVGDMLILKSITLDKKDHVKPALTTKIRPNMRITVIRDGTKVVTVEQEIPTPVKYVTDPSLSFGAEVVRQKGSPGKRVVTYQVTALHGKVVKRKLLHNVVVKDPVPQIVARGSVVDVAANKEKIMKAAGIRTSDYGYVNFIISRESNWNPAARNAGGCLGLGQACPGSKLPCSTSDPVCQLRYFSGYANGRYHGWGGAYNFWTSHNYW